MKLRAMRSGIPSLGLERVESDSGRLLANPSNPLRWPSAPIEGYGCKTSWKWVDLATALDTKYGQYHRPIAQPIFFWLNGRGGKCHSHSESTY
jgi:hypothetical protein